MIAANRYSPRSGTQLLDYLIAEIDLARSARKELEALWLKWSRMYRARPLEEKKNFPWPGAANLVLPVIATDVDIIFARLMAMLFTPQNLWSVRATREDMVDFAPRLQEFLQWAQHNEMQVYEPIADFLLETCKLGTGVLKTRYTREMKKVYEFREAQTIGAMPGQTFERQIRMLLKDHPSVHHVSLFDFFVPGTATDLQTAPWCGEDVYLTWGQFINRVNAGVYTNAQAIAQHWFRERGSEVEKELQSLDRVVPSRGDRLKLTEFWLDWDIDGDGEQEALVCTIHRESRTYVRLDLNPFFNQEKPYDVARYLRQPKRFYGIGIAEMLEHFQEEVTTMHNQRIDAATIQVAPIYKARRGGLIKQGEPIIPGRTVLVDDMEDFQPVLQPQTANSTIPNEQVSLSYANKRTGVNDVIAGGDDPSLMYATATTAVQQLREGSKRFDQVLREVRQAVSGVGTKVTELYQQFNQRGKPFMAMGEKDGQQVMQVLNFPLDIIRSGVLIDVTATSASYNKEVEIRTNTILMQQLTQFYGQLLQYMQLILNPQLPPQLRAVAEQAAVAGASLLRQTLDQYGKQNVDQLVPDIREALYGNQQQLASIQAALGGGGIPAGAPQQPGMGQLGAPGMAPPGAGGQEAGGLQLVG